RVKNCHITNSIIGAGSRIQAESIDESVVGLRARIGHGTQIRRSIIMGQDFYESNDKSQDNPNLDRPSVGIGNNCILEDCIIDKNVRLGCDVTIRPKNRPHRLDTEIYSVRDGLVVIPKNTTVPARTDI
ncbi:MAG: glucose-1-phosphate adenylyltransferase, partial [Planctomycetota bacterium]